MFDHFTRSTIFSFLHLYDECLGLGLGEDRYEPGARCVRLHHGDFSLALSEARHAFKLCIYTHINRERERERERERHTHT